MIEVNGLSVEVNREAVELALFHTVGVVDDNTVDEILFEHMYGDPLDRLPESPEDF